MFFEQLLELIRFGQVILLLRLLERLIELLHNRRDERDIALRVLGLINDVAPFDEAAFRDSELAARLIAGER